VGEPGAGDRRRGAVVADPAGQRDVDPIDAAARELPGQRAQRIGLRPRGDHAVGHHHDPRLRRVAGEPAQRLAEVRGAERPARDQRGLDAADLVGAAVVHRRRHLIERDHLHRQRAAVGAGELVDQLTHRAGLGREAERARRAGVDQDRHRRRSCRRVGQLDPDPRRRQIAGRDRHRRADRRRVDHDVAIRRPVALAQRLLGDPAGAAADLDAHVDALALREPAQRQRVVPRRHLLRVADHQVLVGPGRDREHPRRELVALGLLEQRRILPAVQEVLVGAARELLLDHLGLEEPTAALHREPRHRGAGRQRDRERALADPRLGVVEVEVELGERQRALDHRPGVDPGQQQAAAIGRGQRPRRRDVAGRPRLRGHEQRRDRRDLARRERGGWHRPLCRRRCGGGACFRGGAGRDEGEGGDQAGSKAHRWGCQRASPRPGLDRATSEIRDLVFASPAPAHLAHPRETHPTPRPPGLAARGATRPRSRPPPRRSSPRSPRPRPAG